MDFETSIQPNDAASTFTCLQNKVRLDPYSSITEQFKNVADELANNWFVQTIDRKFELVEFELLLKTTDKVHDDPFTDGSPIQYLFGRWYLPEGGIDITLGCAEYAAAVYIRSLRDLDTGETVVGPHRSFRVLFEDAGNILEPKAVVRLLPRPERINRKLWNVPRVKLPVEEHSKSRQEKLDYMFRPYRFFVDDFTEFGDKYMAHLYLDRVAQSKHSNGVQNSIYSKYLDAFETGYLADDIERLWRISSRSIRLAALLGFQVQKYPHTVR